jgi:hypothetical protein
MDCNGRVRGRGDEVEKGTKEEARGVEARRGQRLQKAKREEKEMIWLEDEDVGFFAMREAISFSFFFYFFLQR